MVDTSTCTPHGHRNTNTEVDRYIAWPGQALGYKLGQMKIIERGRAQTEFGAKFDLRAFHDAVLDSGPLPLDVLERKITEWIRERRCNGRQAPMESPKPAGCFYFILATM